jgi:5-hydroxyisourate hydrolase-like protein (transthyretin family)
MLEFVQSVLKRAEATADLERIARIKSQLQQLQEEARAPQLTTTTDQEGRFIIDKVPPGRHNVRVQRAGYFGDEAVSPSNRAVITITANQTTEVKLSLSPYGGLSGRVLEPKGSPAVGVVVEVLRRAGEPALQSLNEALTNDRGEYRLFDLRPGEYYLVVNPERTRLRGTPIPASPETSAVKTYFPNALESADARLIKIQAEQVLENIDIHLRSK